MNRSKLVLAVALMVGAPALAIDRRPESHEPFILDKSHGKAPVTVSISSPAELNTLWTDWQKRKGVHSKWGDGFWIDWGDGTGDGDSSRGGKTGDVTEVGHHTYASPGTYKVAAGMYQFMPDDSHNMFWRGQTTVTVQAK